jgi:signal peptidase II
VKNKLLFKSLLVISFVILVDQISKFWIKTTMFYGEEHRVFGNWFVIHFTENPGMAFGMEFGGSYGKLILSLFRIVAVFIIGWYIIKLTKKKDTSRWLIICISLIFAGALGNIIDSVFYGLIFNESCSTCQIATFMPAEGGYAGLLHGKVVDMLHFPLFEGHFPKWFPFWGGEKYLFFSPVFNIADSAITIGVILMILFQKKVFGKYNNSDETTKPAQNGENPENI